MSVHLHAPRAWEARNRPLAPLPSAPLASAGMTSGGQTLDRHTQSRMSARFGHDFSSVRIHTDARAGESAAAAGANAFAAGTDIVFGAGRYLPGSRDTDRLLAHELTHVVQQSKSGPGDPARTSDRADSSEREADTLAGDAAAGRAVDVQARPGAAIARDATDDGQRTAMMNNPLLAGVFGMMGMSGSAPAAKPESDWKDFSHNPLWDYGTNDMLSGGIGFGVNKLDPIAEEARRAAPIRDINQEFFHINHPELTPLGQDSSAAARAAQQEGWGANAVVEATADEGLFVPAGRSAEEAEEAVQTASRWETPLKTLAPLKFAGRALSPFGAYSDGRSMLEDWGNGEHVKAGADAAGMVSSGIGTLDGAAALASWTGATGLGGALGSAAEFLNPAGAVLGAFAGGYAGGTALYNHTEVGEDSVDALGGIDSLLGGTPGHSKIVQMDDRRQELWDQGGAWNDTKSIGYGIGEAGIATAGAVGGLAKGAYHGAKALPGKVWDALTDDPYEDMMRDIEAQKGANEVSAQLGDFMDHHDTERIGPSTSVAHEEMPPLPAKGRR